MLLNSSHLGDPPSQFSFRSEVAKWWPVIHSWPTDALFGLQNTAKKKKKKKRERNSLMFKSRETLHFWILSKKVGKSLHTGPIFAAGSSRLAGGAVAPFSHWEGRCLPQAPPSCSVHLGHLPDTWKHIDSLEISQILPDPSIWLNTCFWVNFTIVDKIIP